MSTSEARSAEPLLASSLVGDEELDKGLSSRDCWESLETGNKSLEGVLSGELRAGRIIGIWGEGMDLCRTLLVDSLLQHPESTAAVVDTTGNFDVLKLYTLILSKLQREANILALVRAAAKSGTADTVEDVAAKILDHVKIMRVFDFVGVREAIGEVRDDLEGWKAAKSKEEDARHESTVKTKASAPNPELQSVPKRTVVADSEDEDEDEMLFDISAPAIKPAPVIAVQNLLPEALVTQQQADQDPQPSKSTFILIDNLSQVINPLLKKDYIQANALASTFLHSLTHLTRSHNLHTILLNPATYPRPVSPTWHPDQRKPDPIPSPSIFASTTLLPSLVNVLARYTDMGILVERMPRRKMDARIYYSDGNAIGTKKLRGVEMVSVLEVLWDRWEGRVGEWGVFGEGEGRMSNLT